MNILKQKNGFAFLNSIIALTIIAAIVSIYIPLSKNASDFISNRNTSFSAIEACKNLVEIEKNKPFSELADISLTNYNDNLNYSVTTSKIDNDKINLLVSIFSKDNNLLFSLNVFRLKLPSNIIPSSIFYLSSYQQTQIIDHYDSEYKQTGWGGTWHQHLGTWNLFLDMSGNGYEVNHNAYHYFINWYSPGYTSLVIKNGAMVPVYNTVSTPIYKNIDDISKPVYTDERNQDILNLFNPDNTTPWIGYGHSSSTESEDLIFDFKQIQSFEKIKFINYMPNLIRVTGYNPITNQLVVLSPATQYVENQLVEIPVSATNNLSKIYFNFSNLSLNNLTNKYSTSLLNVQFDSKINKSNYEI